jgi:hypothetical protein
MKKLAMALAFLGLTALTASGQQQSTAVNTSRSNVKNNSPVVGPEGKVWCGTSPAGKTQACTASQVAQLNKALGEMVFSKGGTPKTSVKSIALAKDGSLMCTTSSGAVPCAATHLPDLKQADARVNNELEQAAPNAAPQK